MNKLNKQYETNVNIDVLYDIIILLITTRTHKNSQSHRL